MLSSLQGCPPLLVELCRNDKWSFQKRKPVVSRVLLHSLVFSPDGVSTAHLMADLAVGLKKLGHSVTVLSTTPHYNLDQAALDRQPLSPRWGGLVFFSDFHGVAVWHVKVPMKGHRVWARALDYLRFHLLSAVLCLK